ncbi:PhzF family phenazine biosynthesis protein [Phenylobacterium kunshanense]|uniref:Isomerase n=1 Tax=Phenylobacterium kunshanense TaxID=1445034 RepID=A0A328BML2_9CAUL|nr:PhzF family phenazine biosynthesis protein [Phenylobacterium kunshanense]RAK67226.1 isomerase [Phenylobacterium kunshanense]
MRQWTVDAFAARPFRGNPACVVEPFDAWPADAWMQALAAENNQAETAFLRRTGDPASFDLRWFTPLLEVPLCGHATLASAHVLFAELDLPAEAVRFQTQSGELIVRRTTDGYEMDFPAQPPVRTEVPAGLAEALGAEPAEVWASTYLVALFDDEVTVRGLKPDVAALNLISGKATGGRGNVGVAAMARAGAAHDVVDRFFAPGSGIPEDPATGSLHCILAPLYADKLGRRTVRFHQAYPGRGGDLECEHLGDRVLIRGSAATVIESRLRLVP